MFKNVAGKFIVFAFDATTNVPKTGDAANITAYVSKDDGAVTVLGDTSATEMDATNAPGYYLFDAAQAETNADKLLVSGKSGTANIKVIGAPAVIYTRPAAFGLVAGAAGGLFIAGTNAATTITTALTTTFTGSLTGSVASVTAGVTLAASAVQAIWDAATSALTTVGSIGKLLADKVHAAADVWAVATRILTAGTNIALAKGVGVTGFNDLSAAQVNTEADTALTDAGVTTTRTGYLDNLSAGAVALQSSLAALIATVGVAGAGLTAIWERATSALTTVGSIGKLLVDNINATISSRLASASYTAPPTAADNADAVWDEGIAGHLGAGSTGAALNAAGSAGDPWTTPLPGAYGAGTAGKIVGDNVNASISSRASQVSVDDVPTNAELATALAAADDAVLAAIAALNNLSAAQVNAEVVDAINVDTYAEPGSVPAATASLMAKINWLQALARNKVMQNATTQTLRNNGDSGDIGAAAVSDDGTTFTRGKWA